MIYSSIIPLFALLMSLFNCKQEQAVTLDRIELEPEAWRAIGRVYVLSNHSLVIIDKWDDKPDTLYKMKLKDNLLSETPVEYAKLKQYYNNPCGADDGDDMIVSFYSGNDLLKQVRLYESYQEDVFKICNFINSILEDDSPWKINYDFESHRKSQANCNSK